MEFLAELLAPLFPWGEFLPVTVVVTATGTAMVCEPSELEGITAGTLPYRIFLNHSLSECSERLHSSLGALLNRVFQNCLSGWIEKASILVYFKAPKALFLGALEYLQYGVLNPFSPCFLDDFHCDLLLGCLVDS